MNIRVLALLFSSSFASASEEGVCHACLLGVKELVKSVPILKKATSSVREGDKELALADAMPSFCSSSNFHGYSQELVTDCKTFLTAGNVDGALEKTLIGGEIDESKVCESVCSVVDESLREPKRVESSKPAGGSKTAQKNAKTGTVNDPAYKEALKKKEARDKKRMASAAAAEAEAAADAAAQTEEAKKVKKEKRKVKQPKEERTGEVGDEAPSPPSEL